MLSFMREQGSGDSEYNDGRLENLVPEENQSGTGVSGEEGLQGQGGENGQEGGYLTVSDKAKQVKKSTLILCALFGVGLLCLFFMIKKSGPGSALADTSAQESRIDTVIAQLIGVKSDMFDKMDQIVQQFYEFSDLEQIKDKELARNPFKTDEFMGDLRESAGTAGIDPEVMLQMIRQQKESMQLYSIMQSEQGNCCMIDDKILYEGDSIRGLKIRRISDDFVELESEGLETLGMTDDADAQNLMILKLSQ